MPAATGTPLACAGVTMFNALRRSTARPGDVATILGLGGLGHLGVQFAAAMGFVTVAIARGQEKGSLARELGASHYIDSTSEDVAGSLQELGRAKVVLATVTSGEAMAATIDGLGRRGELIVAGATADPLPVTGLQILGGTKRIYGHASGTALDTEHTLRFAVESGVRAWIEEVPLESAGAALDKMLSGQARFRMVLTTGN